MLKHIYVVKDKKGNSLTEAFLEVNMACAVRLVRSLADEDAIRKQLGRLNRWDDSIMYELSVSDDFTTITKTGEFLLKDVVNLQHDAQAEQRNKELELKLEQAAQVKRQLIKEVLENEKVKN